LPIASFCPTKLRKSRRWQSINANQRFSFAGRGKRHMSRQSAMAYLHRWMAFASRCGPENLHGFSILPTIHMLPPRGDYMTSNSLLITPRRLQTAMNCASFPYCRRRALLNC